MTRQAVVYVRISKDREGGGLGVERQETDCRALAERLGWSVEAVYSDNDISAYSGKPRPGYRSMLADLEAGRCDAVIAWHPARLHRRPIELEEFITVCERHGVAVQTVRAGEVDLSTPTGQAVARTVGAWARHEVDHMVARQRAAKAQAAANGHYRGGRRPYGYEADGVTVRPDEAAVIVDATERVVAGESLHSVTRDLNRRGVPTSTGGPWKPPALRRMLLRARNPGLIENEGREVGPAGWQPVVDVALWRNLRRVVTADDRRPPRSADERWLGSGLFLCGVCADGTTMLSATSRSRSGGGRLIPSYRCRSGAHLTRVATPVDDFVTSLVIERLSRPDARLMLTPEHRRVDVETLHARRADVAGRQNELAGLFADGAVTGAQLAEATRRLQSQAEALDVEIAATVAASPLAGFADATDVKAAWSTATVGRRKSVIGALMTVTIEKAPRGRPAGWSKGEPYFDPRFVKITWRPEDDH